MLFDTHTHVNFQPFQADYQSVLQTALDAGILMNNVGSQWESSLRSVQIADEFDYGVWASVGLHPIHLFSDVTEEQTIEGTPQMIRTRAEQFDVDRYRTLAQSSKKVIAIGECGLDYYHFERANLQDRRQELIQQQITVLKQHIELALELDLPVIFHCRDAAIHDSERIQAFEDMITVIAQYQTNHKPLRGVIHCYTGLASSIPTFLDLGMFIGYTGIVTFDNATEVRAAVQATPIDRILLETDAPYLSPAPHRGKRNQPLYVELVAKKIAALKQVSESELAAQTTKNAFELFGIS